MSTLRHPLELDREQRNAGEKSWREQMETRARTVGRAAGEEYRNPSQYPYQVRNGMASHREQTVMANARMNFRNESNRERTEQIQDYEKNLALATDEKRSGFDRIKAMAKSDIAASKAFPGQISDKRVELAEQCIRSGDQRAYSAHSAEQVKSYHAEQGKNMTRYREIGNAFERNMSNNKIAAEEHKAAKTLLSNERNQGGHRGESARAIGEAEKSFERADQKFHEWCLTNKVNNTRDMMKLTPEQRAAGQQLFNDAADARSTVNFLAKEHVKAYGQSQGQAKESAQSQGQEARPPQAQAPQAQAQEQRPGPFQTREQNSALDDMRRSLEISRSRNQIQSQAQEAKKDNGQERAA